MAKQKKKKKEAEEAGGGWIVTYSDMVTLMLCFFVALFNPDDIDPAQVQSLVAYFNNTGLGLNFGGSTFSVGKAAELGNTINNLPSQERGRALGTAFRMAVSMFNPEVRSSLVKVTQDERGLIISLASDAFLPLPARRSILRQPVIYSSGLADCSILTRCRAKNSA
jgi:chemotaxis protein MotB